MVNSRQILRLRSGQVLSDGLPIVPSEVDDGLEVRCEAFDEPHHLDIAIGFPFQLATGADVIEVTIDIQLQKITRVLKRSSSFLKSGMGKTYLVKIKGIDKGINEASGVILRDVVVQGFGEEDDLVPDETFDMFHSLPRSRQMGELSLLSH